MEKNKKEINIGDLVINTRNTQKYYGIGLVLEKELWEIGLYTKEKEYYCRIYWFGIKEIRGTFEGNHHLQKIEK